MKENGYIRKIDELGRIVIPKELRQKLKIHEGENLLINSNDKNINLSKYSYIESNINFIQLIGDKTYLFTNFNVVITDLEHIIYSNKKFSNSSVHKNLISYINSRESAKLQKLEITPGDIITSHICIEPIISSSICIGLVIMYSNNNDDYLIKIAKLLASVISIHLDIA